MRRETFAERRSGTGTAITELVVVLIVLGLLAFLGAEAVRAYNSYSRTMACKAAKREVRGAAAAYFADHDRQWAPDTAALVRAGLLAEEPGGAGYTITYHSDGSVTASGACH
jgi:Tfp pilus assembly protein PilE